MFPGKGYVAQFACRNQVLNIILQSVAFPSDGSEEGTTSSWLIPGMKENVCGIIASKNGSSNDAQGLLCHRSDLYEELKRLATGEGEGPPAKLCLGTKVVSSDPEEGTVTLDGGEIVHGDCILGADGIHVGTPLFFAVKRLTRL